MTEATKGSCSNPIGLKEKIGPSECQTMASEFHAGRMLFRGVDMVFLMVNGHEMLTLHDILGKLLPTTSRSTFCVRIKKMNALRYACKRLEIRKIKALGGAKRSAIKCTVIAREHIDEYCEKYNVQNDASREKFPPEVKGNAKSCLENQQGYAWKSSSIRNRFRRINSGVAEDGSVSVNNDERGLKCRNDNANGGDEENITGNDGNVIREISQIETKVSRIKENGKSKKQNVCPKKRNIRQSAKRSNSVSWSSAGAISQQRQTEGEGKMDQPCRVLKRRVTTSGIGESVRKRKPKTKSKQVQTRCDEITDDNDTGHKRQKTSCYLNGNGRAAANTIKGHQASIERDSSSASLKRSLAPSLTLDLSEFTPSTERSRNQIFQAFNNEVVNDESNANAGETAKCYLDELEINNNSSEIEVPHSPTLLLMRTVNNEWQVAKSCLPRLDFDGDEVKLLSGDEAAETNHVHSASSTDPKIYNATVPAPKAVIKPSIKTATQTNESSTSTLKKSVAVGQRILLKKNGRFTGGKTKAFKTTEQELTKPNEVNRFVFNTKDINSGANVIGNDCSDGVKSSESNSSISSLNGTTKDAAQTRRNAAKDKSNNGSVQKAKTTNKTLNGAVAVKQKRRRRVQLNTFRLIETIPYSSLLVVKDGDLCPSHTMTYSDAKDLPHCCHALWRWRLGKPVPVHPKGTAQVGRTSSGEPQKDQESYVNTVNWETQE